MFGDLCVQSMFAQEEGKALRCGASRWIILKVVKSCFLMQIKYIFLEAFFFIDILECLLV